MFNSGTKFRALRDKNNKYSNSCVVRNFFWNETKNHGRSLITNNTSTTVYEKYIDAEDIHVVHYS